MAADEIWTTLKILAWTKDYLLSKGVDNARLEAEWLLCAATGLDRVGLYLQYDKPLNDSELAQFRAMVARRGRREPLQAYSWGVRSSAVLTMKSLRMC